MDLFSSYNEKELLVLLSRGDNHAFTEIYNRYWDKLFSVAANKVGNLAEAEELVQDIFLDIWKRKKELDITTNLGAYLAVAIKYKIINTLAKRNQQLCYCRHAETNNSGADLATEQWLSFEELKERLGKSVAALPEKCRLVFQLSRENGLSQKEIAFHMGIAEKTVESHLARALRSLRAELKGFLMTLL